MSVTKPGDLVGMTWDGDNAATEATNEMSKTAGFPLKVGDELVNVVAKNTEGQGVPEFHAEDGRVFVRVTEGFGFMEKPSCPEDAELDVEPEVEEDPLDESFATGAFDDSSEVEEEPTPDLTEADDEAATEEAPDAA